MDCANDNSLGPSVRGCRGDFDFTLTFQRIFLVIVPAGVFIALSIARLAYLVQKRRIVNAVALQIAKLVVIAVHSSLQLALLIIAAKQDGHGRLSIAALSVSLAASVSMLPLSFAEHSRSPRPSTLLNTYLLVTLLFDIVQTRTWWLVANANHNRPHFAGALTALVASKMALVVLEAVRKSRWVRWNAKDHSPEETSGILGLGVYSWLHQLFRRGYKGVLIIDDLYPLDHDMASETLYPRLEQRLETLRYKGRRLGLARALFKALAVPALLPIAPRIALLGFTYSQPFFIETLLEHLQMPDSEAKRKSGYGLIGAAVFIFGGIAISEALYRYFSYRALFMARGCLCAAVYRKTTQSKTSAVEDKAALTLMSTDVERIIRGLQTLHDWWASIIEVALGSWLLQRQLGTAFLAPIVTILVCAGIMSRTSVFIGKFQAAWMVQIQKRVGLTASAIANMKSLKISGLVGPVAAGIQKLRLAELHAGNKFRQIIVVTVVVAYVPQILAPVVTFAVTSRNLTTTSVYTSLSYILLLSTPLAMIFQSLPGFLAAFTCLGRIQTFLDDEPRIDTRKFAASPESISSSSDSEKKSPVPRPRPAPGARTGTGTGTGQPNFDVAISISNGNFGYTPDKTVLKDINVSIPAGCLTMVVGPVASGKSTFCRALLGEVPISEGEVRVSGLPASIGFCDQTPFLLNATLQENIVGHSLFDQKRYDDIIEATRLGADVSLLPSGHDTQIGSNGIMLSGGQKQRVALARALYLDSYLLIFDDILSGLDNDTATEVFRRVFGPDGLVRMRGATALLCTHSVRHLPSADHIVALGTDGTVVEDGTFDDLMNNNSYVQSLGVKAGGGGSGSGGGADTSSESDKESAAESKPQPAATAAARSAPKAGALSNTLDKARQLGDWRTYRYYFSALSPLTIAVVTLVACLFGFGNNFGTVWVGFWTEDKYSRTNAFYIGIFALLRCGQLISLGITCFLIMVPIVTMVGSRLHQTALDTIVTAPLKFFTSTDSGIVTNLFSQDMTLIDGELHYSLINAVIDSFDVIGMAFVIATATPYLAVSYPVLIFVLYMLQKFYLRTSRQMRLLDLEAKSPLYTHFLDTIKGVATLRAFGWTQQDISKNNLLLDTSQRPAYLLQMIQQWLGLALHLVVLSIATILVALATQLSTSAGFTGASLITLMYFGESMTNMIRTYTMLETSIGAVARLKTFSEQVVPEDVAGEDTVPPEEWPQRGEIRISDLSASYRIEEESAGLAEKDDGDTPSLALKDVSLTIQPGDKVAICGRTGSGKSSLVLVLLKLLDPLPSCSENITIDELPLHKIDRATLRSRIIAIPQEVVFLPDGSTVKANLDPFDATSEEECITVLEAVQLGSFVRERGGILEGMAADSLSAGQKQLFSLGRAILRRRVRDRKSNVVQKGGILLLDEVSSNVDKDTDRTMLEIIKEEFGHYTIVMVSHRLEMVLDFFDFVVVLDKGSVVEMGHPRKLVETEGSRFGELWAMGSHTS